VTEPVATPDDLAVDLTHRRSSRVLVIVLGVLLAAAAVVVAIAVLRKPTYASPSAEERRALADESCPKVTTPRMFRVTKDGKTSYMLGTRHAGVSLAQFPATVEQAFRDARVAVFESAMDGTAFGKPTETSVEDQLGPDLWDKYREIVGDDVAEAVNHQSASYAASALVLAYEDVSRRIDRELLDSARKADKRIVFLEDGDESSHLIEEYLGIDSLRGLVKTANPRSTRLVVRVSLTEYCTGKREVGFVEDHSYDSVTDRRTKAWVPKLVPLLADGDAFVAVGMQHVEGTVNLVELLHGEGFTVQPAW
jgi:uncharacterized protein YbaP (TraB family)